MDVRSQDYGAADGVNGGKVCIFQLDSSAALTELQRGRIFC